MKQSFIFILFITYVSTVAYGDDWELYRNDLTNTRPPVENGVVSITIGEPECYFPRYLHAIGIEKIRIHFKNQGSIEKKISIVWSGGSHGPDKFAVSLDGVAVGTSRTVITEQHPFSWKQDEFICKLSSGVQHVLEISTIEGFESDIEFAGIRMAATDSEYYHPLCYESVGSLQKYEEIIGTKGVVLKSEHLWVFAPHEDRLKARLLAKFLEKAYGELKNIFGIDAIFKFSVEHYPKGTKRAWGGIKGTGTIGYPNDALEKFFQLKKSDVRAFAGYLEEMCHGFKAYYKGSGTYEALSIAVLEDVTRRFIPRRIADNFWLNEHQNWKETYEAYINNGYKNPNPNKYPWNVFYTRILNYLFLKFRNEYGSKLWPDFFQTMRNMDYPLYRATRTDRMKVYAEVFSILFKRDMHAEFRKFGIDLDADPPWGWETYK